MKRRHPQDVPLIEWTDGWLVLSVCSYTDATYMIATDEEKRERGWPVGRIEMIALLIRKDDIPRAGIGEGFVPPDLFA